MANLEKDPQKNNPLMPDLNNPLIPNLVPNLIPNLKPGWLKDKREVEADEETEEYKEAINKAFNVDNPFHIENPFDGVFKL